MISDRAVPGSNSTTVSSSFLRHISKSKDSEKFQSRPHVRRWPPHVCASALSGGYYRDLQTSGQSMCSNGRLAIETSIQNLKHIFT